MKKRLHNRLPAPSLSLPYTCRIRMVPVVHAAARSHWKGERRNRPHRLSCDQSPAMDAESACSTSCTDAGPWSFVKAGHWETFGYRHTIWRAVMLVRKSSGGCRIEEMARVLGSSLVTMEDPAGAVHAYMRLSGGSEKLGRAMRVLAADYWVFFWRQRQVDAAWPLIYSARKQWQTLGLSAESYSRWMQAIWKSVVFYWSAAREAVPGGCVADDCLQCLSV